MISGSTPIVAKQVHTDIIAALDAAVASSSIHQEEKLAVDFDSQDPRDGRGLHQDGTGRGDGTDETDETADEGEDEMERERRRRADTRPDAPIPSNEPSDRNVVNSGADEL